MECMTWIQMGGWFLAGVGVAALLTAILGVVAMLRGEA